MAELKLNEQFLSQQLQGIQKKSRHDNSDVNGLNLLTVPVKISESTMVNSVKVDQTGGSIVKGFIGRTALAIMIYVSAAQPAQACWNEASQSAVKITHLNTMLLVTALRCRGGVDNFLPEYNRFVVNNSKLIGEQARIIREQFTTAYGVRGAEGALDRMTIGFANSYGTGHQFMDCGALKALADELASQNLGVTQLTQAADGAIMASALPGDVCPLRIAVVR